MMINNPKYTIGDRVYHITKESDEGIIIDATYSVRFRSWEYVVTFKAGEGG